ncbi:GNAT family N-acetyltransferase [Paracoccus sp. (in: a-proteobacteria)]|uniref:GNAT family N-acetyltransferase n=1 Tax=Paracoccus sp. TaxID=267 RepID=UPI0026DF7293|nr:GNAT family N-acyltransferase [Paracoccus sp. (in: a-proteobacteria)]MDO5648645.1 GNAT family N-acyltransferase [Paracoccus sp. (in: a-proteobacteria)]
MQPFRKGRYVARLGQTQDDIRAAQRLRWLCFIGRNGVADDGDAVDQDELDRECHHVLISDETTGQLVCCFRFLSLSGGSEIARSYSAQFYNLARLETFDGPMVEMGRFCIHPESRDPDIVRIAWAAMTRYVDEAGIEMLFGCSSFTGIDPETHADAFAMLKERHLAPRRWWPRVKAPRVFRFARALRLRKPDPKAAMAAMPPLLRSYLAMGGWVSDHAVVDPALRTMHVFTGVEIRAIPPARRRLLRAVAG